MGMTADGSLTEGETVGTAGERELLEGFLEYHRRVVGGKLRGLSQIHLGADDSDQNQAYGDGRPTSS
jgi:hypothetical protein